MYPVKSHSQGVKYGNMVGGLTKQHKNVPVVVVSIKTEVKVRRSLQETSLVSSIWFSVCDQMLKFVCF